MIKNRIAFMSVGCSAAIIALSGCGGSGSASSPSGGSTSLNLGDAKVSYVGKATPFTTVAGTTGLTITGLAGASITELILEPTANLANTSIAFASTDSSNGSQIWTDTTGALTQVTRGVDSSFQPKFTPAGQPAFSYADPVTGVTQIAICNPDGSGLKLITSSKIPHNNIAWAPSNTKIAFNDNANNLYTVSVSGGVETKIATGNQPAWSIDSKSLLASVPGTGGVSQIYSMTAAGATPVLISSKYAGFNCTNPTWSPDGKTIAYDVNDGTKGNIIVEANATTPTDVYVFPGGTGSDFYPSFSPDSSSLVFVRNSAVMTAGVNGNNPTPLPSNNAVSVSNPSWSPFLATKTFVGLGGTFFNAAAGFMVTRLNDSFASVLAFEAATPSAATCTLESGSGTTGELVYDLHADIVTTLAYTEGYNLPATSLLVNVSDVLVYISGTTGQIELIAPFIAKPHQSPAATRIGGNFVYSQHFTAVYDGTGKNLAPGGAATITLDGSTGKLISVH